MRSSIGPEMRFWYLVTTESCRGQKTVVFHFNFGCEIVANVRHDNWSRYSMANLRLADKALGRTK
jgi:hypothetical protein